jgi:hypothetical protein
MDILISVLIAGFASGYSLEFITSLIDGWVSPRLIKLIFTLPFSFAALLLLGVSGGKIFVYACASGFVSLVIMAAVSKPVEVQTIRRR